MSINKYLFFYIAVDCCIFISDSPCSISLLGVIKSI